MDSLHGITPAMLNDQATQSDLVRRKLEMDSLRTRLGDSKSKEEKLRESCEGFEAIFLQKMWEQMRKTVPKEGYLHSKDEEAYQSLFDIELCKKMANAGGIGLADMLYEQLSQQLVNSGRTTSPGSYRIPLEIAPAGLTASTSKSVKTTPARDDETDKKLTAESLYSPLPSHQEENDADPNGKSVEAALHDLKISLGKSTNGEAGAAVREWAEARDLATGAAPKAVSPGNTATQAPDRNAAQKPGTSSGDLTAPDTMAGASGVRTGNSHSAAAKTDEIQVSEKQDPAAVADNRRLFGRRKKKDKASKTEAIAKAAPAQPRGMVPEGTLWPLSGEGGVVTSHFGWEDDKASGRRRWNSGVSIAAPGQSAVRAVLDGTVVYAGQREGFGHTVVMEHKDGFRSYYSNLTNATVRVGDKVSHGAEFAQISAPAPSQAKGEKAASLYFELKKGEMALNPENAIERRGA